MYSCIMCNYETHNSGNFSHHKKSKKHMQNVQNKNVLKISDPESDPKSDHKNSEKIICILCGNIFTSKTNMYRHRRKYCEYIKKSSEDDNILKETIDKLEKQNQNLEKQNQTLMDIVKKQSNVVENNSEAIKKSSETINKSINVLSFVAKQYPNAPPIEELEYDKFNEITKCLMYDNKKKKINHSIEEIILFYFERNKLPETLGKAIVQEYKKDNPNDQSMWASDVSRLSFIVKSVIGRSSKKSKWVSDKNGVHFTELIIKPMFEIIKDKMRTYIKNKKIEDSEIRDNQMEDITARLGLMQSAGELIRQINLSKFDKKVLKYVAPYFNLNIDNSDESDIESTDDTNTTDDSEN